MADQKESSPTARVDHACALGNASGQADMREIVGEAHEVSRACRERLDVGLLSLNGDATVPEEAEGIVWAGGIGVFHHANPAFQIGLMCASC